MYQKQRKELGSHYLHGAPGFNLLVVCTENSEPADRGMHSNNPTKTRYHTLNILQRDSENKWQKSQMQHSTDEQNDGVTPLEFLLKIPT